MLKMSKGPTRKPRFDGPAPRHEKVTLRSIHQKVVTPENITNKLKTKNHATENCQNKINGTRGKPNTNPYDKPILKISFSSHLICHLKRGSLRNCEIQSDLPYA